MRDILLEGTCMLDLSYTNAGAYVVISSDSTGSVITSVSGTAY